MSTTKLTLGGHWKFQAYDCLADMRAGMPLWEVEFDNTATFAGINDLLDKYFRTGVAAPLLYIGLVDNVGFGAFSQDDTMASHVGWTENTAYSEATRRQWTPGAAAGQSISNVSANATFTASGAASILGGFVTTSSVKGGTAGLLWATGNYSSPKVLTTGQLLHVAYTCSLSSTA